LLSVVGIIYIAMFITQCKNDTNTPDTSEMTLTVTAERFEKDLFTIDNHNPGKGISAIKKKYGNFFNLYTNQITAIGSTDSVLMTERLLGFINDSNFRIIYNDCEKLYSDFSRQNSALTEAFR